MCWCLVSSALIFALVSSFLFVAVVHPVRYADGPTYHSVGPGEGKVRTFPSRVLSNVCFIGLSMQFQYPAYYWQWTHSSEDGCWVEFLLAPMADSSTWWFLSYFQVSYYSLFSNGFMLCLDHKGHVHAHSKLWLIYISCLENGKLFEG